MNVATISYDAMLGLVKLYTFGVFIVFRMYQLTYIKRLGLECNMLHVYTVLCTGCIFVHKCNE